MEAGAILLVSLQPSWLDAGGCQFGYVPSILPALFVLSYIPLKSFFKVSIWNFRE